MNPVDVLDADLRHLVEPAHGLEPAIFYVMTFLDAVDGSTRWMPRRAYHPTATRSMYLPEAPGGADFVLSPDAKRAHTGPVRCGTGPDLLSMTAAGGATALTATATHLSWAESELLEVSGASTGPACRLQLADPAYPLIYTTRPYLLAGTVKDTPVVGAGLLVAIHLPHGADLVASPLLSRLQISWTEFINCHRDGSVESGLLVRGREGLAGMALSRADGTTFATSAMTVTIENDNGTPEFPRRIAHAADGETVIWQALPAGGRWPTRDDIPDGYRFRRGTVHRVGAEAPTSSYAFTETFQERM